MSAAKFSNAAKVTNKQSRKVQNQQGKKNSTPLPTLSNVAIEKTIEFPKGYEKQPFTASGFWKSKKNATLTEFKGVKEFKVCESKQEFYAWLDSIPSRNEEAYVMLPFTEGKEFYVGFVPRFVKKNVVPKQNKNITAPKVLSRVEMCNRDEWEHNVELIKTAIKKRSVEKVVLARKVSLLLEKSVKCETLIDLVDFDDAYQIGFELPGLSVFSVSPESLFEKNGDVVKSYAIAGTRRRGKSSTSDKTFENDLKASKKERMEHQFVVDAIEASLQGICSEVEKLKSFEILKQAKVQHLQSTYQGVLNEQTLSAIIESLSPTPAVAGTPKQKGLEIIHDIETENRGYFSGLFGRVNGSEAEFVVNIRSAFLRKNIVELWSGAGIVKDSNAPEEWNELEHKIQHYLDAFNFSDKP